MSKTRETKKAVRCAQCRHFTMTVPCVKGHTPRLYLFGPRPCGYKRRCSDFEERAK